MSGPTTRYSQAWALGLMQIRVGECAGNISTTTPVLTASNSLGAQASTRFLSNNEFFKQQSGFPLKQDGIIPLREASAIACGFKEVTPYNMALAFGKDPTLAIAASVSMDVSYVSAAGGFGAGKTTGITVVDGTPADWAPVTDTWVIVFDSDAAYKCYGMSTGLVQTGAAADGTVAGAFAPVDGDSKKYFNIPANFFDGNWAAGDTYVFRTTRKGSASADYPSDPTAWGGATDWNEAKSIGLGGMVSPADIRIEAVYTYPNGKNQLVFVLPRAQATAEVEADFAEEEPVAIPIQFDAQVASSENSAGNAAWDSMPLGAMYFRYNASGVS